jgi:hypothetical protein
MSGVSVQQAMSVAGTFTIQFHEHLPESRWQYYIQWIQSIGVQVQQTAPRQFLLVCESEQQISRVGLSLFRRCLKSYLNVLAVSGLASAQASSYHSPKSRAERKKYHG